MMRQYGIHILVLLAAGMAPGGCSAVADGTFPSVDLLKAKLTQEGYAADVNETRSEIVEWRSVRVVRLEPDAEIYCSPQDPAKVVGFKLRFRSTDSKTKDGLSKSYNFARGLVRETTGTDIREIPRSEFGLPPLFGFVGRNYRASAATDSHVVTCLFYERIDYMSWAEVTVLQKKW
ncbi:MAG: hypothetical protein ABFD92_12155 [Planctomycetaceae bacterium]|nr:hypothetical protein [Planctomycetaceae bacterium]